PYTTLFRSQKIAVIVERGRAAAPPLAAGPRARLRGSERNLCRNFFHDIDRAAQQRLGRLRRAEGGVSRKRDVFELGQRVIGLEWLLVEHVEPGVAEVAVLERRDQRHLVGERAA